VCRVPCAVCRVPCAVCRVPCAVCRVPGSTCRVTLGVHFDKWKYISGVNPVLSPMSGGVRITILGERFDNDCGVEIGGLDCTIVERIPGTLVGMYYLYLLFI
jgi:hypothetical protein